MVWFGFFYYYYFSYNRRFLGKVSPVRKYVGKIIDHIDDADGGSILEKCDRLLYY